MNFFLWKGKKEYSAETERIFEPVRGSLIGLAFSYEMEEENQSFSAWESSLYELRCTPFKNNDQSLWNELLANSFRLSYIWEEEMTKGSTESMTNFFIWISFRLSYIWNYEYLRTFRFESLYEMSFDPSQSLRFAPPESEGQVNMDEIRVRPKVMK